MREMEEGSRLVAGFSGGVIKKNRKSTGCLIIKKKADGSGAGGMNSSPAPGQVGDKVYTSRKKRARLIESQLESSDEDEEPLGLYKRTGRGNRVSGSSNSHVFEDEFGGAKDAFFSGNEMLTGKRNRNMFDVYDFDGYDDLDDVGFKSNFGWLEAQGSGRMFTAMKPAAKTGGRREFEAVPSSRRGAMGDMTSFRSESSSSKKFNRTFGIKSRHPVPALDEKFDNSSSKEAIRLQGKNGVLKLMVKNKKVGGPSTAPNPNAVGRNITSLSRDINPKDMVTPPPLYPERNVQRHTRNFDRMKQKSRKPVSSESSEESEDESEESDEPPKRPVTGVESHKAPKREKREDEDNSPQTCPASGSKESKVKRGSGTEKQLLREKIRNMLVGAGWTIDYRRRRNRDYFDAVYINPSGTAYWSIIKAYDALQKQLEEQGATEKLSPFNSISGEVLSKLTRQTQKKLEKELKRKKRDDIVSKRKKKAGPGKFVDDERETDSADSGSEKEKLSSFIKQNGRSLKGRPRDFNDGQQSSRSGNMHEQAEKPSFASNYQPVHGRKTKKIGRCTLLVRRAEKGMNEEGDGFIPYKGKRTILSWLIDSDVVKLSEKVLYMSRKRSRVLLEGWITRDGIHCGCCSKILTVSKFEIHAASKQRQPFQNIYLCSGNSLLQCQVDAWNIQEEIQCRGFNTIDVDGDDPNDDTCGICGDGGNLICCDGCPSTFHQSCVGVELLPTGDWHCQHCSCRFCGLADGTSGVLQNCSFCEKKFHASCIQEVASISPSPNSPTSLCGRRCVELFEQLQKLLGVKHELESGLSWSFIHRTDLDIDPSHRGFAQRVEWNSKLAVALTVMDECFLPIMDRRSGINLIHSVLYNSGSNFNRLNYSGFYTAILERGDEIISVASIRIHGSQLAEMPFIGTRHIYRRQGMCRRLLFAIESALRSLKVEKLIIPAISELMHTWTSVFGFSGLDESHKLELKSLNMLVFPGTDMLQKKIVDQESKGDMSSSSGTDPAKNSDSEGSPNQTDMLETVQTDRKSAKGICLQDTVVSVDQSSHPDSHLDSCDEAEPRIHNKGTQETQSSPLELKEELVKFDSDAKIISSSDPSDDALKAGESILDTPMMDDVHGSAACEDSDINGVKEFPADSGLGVVTISSAADPVEQNPSDHIEDAKTCSRSGEGLPTASHDDLLMQDPVRGEFQAEIGSQHVPDSEMDAAPENKSKAGDIDSVVNAPPGASFTVVDTCSEGNNKYRPVTEDPMMGLSSEDIFEPYQGVGMDTHGTNIIAAEDPMLDLSSEDIFQPLKEGGVGKAIPGTIITAADTDSTPDTEGASTLLLHPYLNPVLDSSFKDTIGPLLEAHENTAPEINGKVPGDTDYLMNASSPVSTSGLDPSANGTYKSNLGASAEANSQLHVGDENGLPHAKGSISDGTSTDSSDKSQMEERLPVAALDANNELPHFAGIEIHRKEEPHLGSIIESETTNCASGGEACTGSVGDESDANVARN